MDGWMDLGSNKEATTVTERGSTLASYWRSVSCHVQTAFTTAPNLVKEMCHLLLASGVVSPVRFLKNI